MPKISPSRCSRGGSDDFLQWAILSDMDFMGVDSKRYHYQATVCVPDGASCYMVNITAGKDGGLAFELVR